MIFSNTAARRACVAATLATVFLSGCATTYRPGSPEAMVKEKATARWDALIKSDFDTAYKLTAPSYRAVSSLERYRTKFNLGSVNWTDAEVVKVECEPEKCNVTLKVGAYLPMLRTFKEPAVTAIEETWVKEDGGWWLFQRL